MSYDTIFTREADMRIQSINNNHEQPSIKAGLYFTKNREALFNKDAELKSISDEFVKVTKEGRRYVEDTQISAKLKERFAQITFIKNLAEKFDTFVFYSESLKDLNFNLWEDNISYAKVIWKDNSKTHAEERVFIGMDYFSQEGAIEELFKILAKYKPVHILD